METRAHILIIDDEARNHDIMRHILGGEFALSHACNGEEGLASATTNPPDLILLDIMMPGMDGYEVCARLKQQEPLSEVPVVFVSAKDSVEERLRGYDVGGADYFVKPFDHDELQAKIKRLLAMRAAQRELASRVAQANSVAFQAMTTSSELGMILGFMEQSLSVADLQELTSLLFEITRAMGLSCSLQIRDGAHPLHVSDSGTMSPMEESVLSHLQTRGRIVDFKMRTVVNFQHISVLIKNMPLDDPSRYGVIKDNICFLLSAAEARIKSILTERERQLQRQLLVELLGHTSRMLDQLNANYKHLRATSYGIVENMAEKLNDVVPRLGLEEYQENSIFSIAEECVNGTRALYDSSLLVDDRFARVVAQLSRVTGSADVQAALLLQLIDSLKDTN